MSPELENTIRKQFTSLPDALQKYAVSSEISERIAHVVSESGLTLEQKKKLEIKILLVVVGIILPTELVTDLSKGLGISEKPAKELALKIDSMVLSPVRDILKAIETLTLSNEISSPDETRTISSTQDKNIPTAAKRDSAIEERILPQKTPPPPSQSGPIPNLRTMPRDLARLKMQESVRLPKDEISMRYKTEEAQHAAPKKTEESPKQEGPDPYRELPQ